MDYLIIDNITLLIFTHNAALLEDVNICLQACSSLHALSASLPDDLLQRYLLFQRGCIFSNMFLLYNCYYLFFFNLFDTGVLMCAEFN